MTGTVVYPVLGHPQYGNLIACEVIGKRVEVGELEVLLSPTQFRAAPFWEVFTAFKPTSIKQKAPKPKAQPKSKSKKPVRAKKPLGAPVIIRTPKIFNTKNNHELSRRCLPPEFTDLWPGTLGDLRRHLFKLGLPRHLADADISSANFRYLMGEEGVPIRPFHIRNGLVDDQGRPNDLGRLIAARYLFRLSSESAGAMLNAS